VITPCTVSSAAKYPDYCSAPLKPRKVRSGDTSGLRVTGHVPTRASPGQRRRWTTRAVAAFWVSQALQSSAREGYLEAHEPGAGNAQPAPDSDAALPDDGQKEIEHELIVVPDVDVLFEPLMVAKTIVRAVAPGRQPLPDLTDDLRSHAARDSI